MRGTLFSEIGKHSLVNNVWGDFVHWCIVSKGTVFTSE